MEDVTFLLLCEYDIKHTNTTALKAGSHCTRNTWSSHPAIKQSWLWIYGCLFLFSKQLEAEEVKADLCWSKTNMGKTIDEENE